MTSGPTGNRRNGSFAAAMTKAENRFETSSRRVRADVAFIPDERPPTLGPLAARAYGETSADGPPNPRDESAQKSNARKEDDPDTNPASPDHHNGRNIMTVLRHRADKARSVEELNKLRSLFAKGFHPDRKTGASRIDQGAIMGEANALIDAAIARLRHARTTSKEPTWPA